MNGIILFVALIMFLWLGRSILIPLLVATFLWYLINATATYVRKLFPFNSAKMRVTRPIVARTFDWVSNILSVLAMCGLLYFFATQIQPMFRELSAALPELQHKFVQFGNYLSQSLGLHFDAGMIPNIANIAAGIGASVAGIVTSTGMILVYMIFLFVEQSTFNKKFSALIPNKKEYKKARFIVDSIDENMKKKDLQALTGLSASSIAKLSRDEMISMDALIKICAVFGVQFSDVVEIVYENADNTGQ